VQIYLESSGTYKEIDFDKIPSIKELGITEEALAVARELSSWTDTDELHPSILEILVRAIVFLDRQTRETQNGRPA